ncbi:PAN domain-containing protein At5g03700 [Cynara cardunculus var. scolymus]|uniref:PAN domain-containing protein At5g03700 n=1 Tax=Cynara cardunculus var. scolymus TaxID=59895 RepID=UPI000D626CF1|nr:PAN domain-containing protein At5g03700 [Cynara cardunculus var. scolymus]
MNTYKYKHYIIYSLPPFTMYGFPIIYTAILLLLSPPNAALQELLRGFTATPDSSLPVSSFQPLLTDSIGNYSLAFLRVDRTHLALAVIHVSSQVPLWIAGKSPLAPWSSQTRLSFNGSLVISHSHTGVFWSTYTDGHRVRLSNTSNLLIESEGESPVVVWQSFDFPYNTLVENQNFTSAMKLVSSNGMYSMKLGSDFIGFYARFATNSGPDSDPGRLYFQHNPMETKAHITKGEGPIHATLSPNGFLGLYQNSSNQVDLQPFSSFQQPGTGNRIIRLEPDGNLIGYYWTGSSWVVDFKQIANPCDLPSSCGAYGLCRPGNSCSCLDNRRSYSSGDQCETSGDDFCRKRYRVLRRSGVELANKEIMAYTMMSSLEKCERACEEKCTCWGAVYSNTSGFCYAIDYPVQTLVEVMDETKMGYFKVREGAGKDKMGVGLWVGLGSLCGVVLLISGVGGVVLYRKESRGVKGYEEEEGINGGVGPYKNLRSASSKSIELSER